MICSEIENRLPAFLEELLSPEEGKSVEAHLASCNRCRRAFADLQRAQELVQGLGEVEPPPFFEQRIMSRVREESEKKPGILRKLFYPLHTKVPIQALATVLIAVLAFHVFHVGEPERKGVAPLPIPLAEPGKDRMATEPPGTVETPSAETPAGRPPEGDLPAKHRQRLAAPPPEKEGKADRIADSQAPRGEGLPAAVKSEVPAMAAREMEAPPAGAEALGDAREALMPERKREKMASAGTAAESGKMAAAPAPAQRTVAEAVKRPVTNLTIRVADPGAAIREIEELLGRAHARSVGRQRRDGGEILTAEIPADRIASFLDRLGAIGEVDLEKRPLAFQDGDVTVRIKIVGSP